MRPLNHHLQTEKLYKQLNQQNLAEIKKVNSTFYLSCLKSSYQNYNINSHLYFLKPALLKELENLVTESTEHIITQSKKEKASKPKINSSTSKVDH